MWLKSRPALRLTTPISAEPGPSLNLAPAAQSSPAGPGRLVRRGAELYPGLMAVGTMAIAAEWLSQRCGAPVTLVALLLGMMSHSLDSNPRCAAGLRFASQWVLRVGVALLGARITLAQLSGLGLLPVGVVLVGLPTTIVLGVLLSRKLGLTTELGLLSGGAVAICGASAAMAIATVLPPHPTRERETLVTVVGVTALSTVAMLVYPSIATALGLGGSKAGIFLGGSIHDVAQVVGAGYAISANTGDIATYVKLLRVACLLPVAVLLATIYLRRSDTAAPVPRAPQLFLLGFAACVALNSSGFAPLRRSPAHKRHRAGAFSSPSPRSGREQTSGR
jgi:uncharacterized integral membrane protein (TIGR00698 family)